MANRRRKSLLLTLESAMVLKPCTQGGHYHGSPECSRWTGFTGRDVGGKGDSFSFNLSLSEVKVRSNTRKN